jgi:hypothetical protein
MENLANFFNISNFILKPLPFYATTIAITEN